MMLNDEQFFVYWAKNSTKELHNKRAFLLGLSSGFAIGVCVLLCIFSGWYQRATMVANSKMSAAVLFIAIIGISVFIALVYQKFKWEKQDQRYQAILARKNKINAYMQP